MNHTIAFLAWWTVIARLGRHIMGFQKLCLNKINSGVLRYSLGMMLAYGILIMLYVATNHYLPLKTVILNWYILARSWRNYLNSYSCLIFNIPYRERLLQ